MVKSGKDLTSLMELTAGLGYMLVIWLTWLEVSQSTIGILAPLLWGMAVLCSFSLIFISSTSLIFGWTESMLEEARWCLRISGVALFAIAAGVSHLGVLPLQGGIGNPGGALDWVWYTAISFAIGWLGLARAELKK